MRRGNVYQLANGYMGYRGTLDEFGAQHLVGVTLAGIFDRVGSAWREPVNAPNAGYSVVALDGVELSAIGGHAVRHEQSLDFAEALFERETVFSTGGKTLTLKSSRFLSAHTPNLGVIRLSVCCDQAADICIRTGIDGNIWDLNGPHLPNLASERHADALLTHGYTQELGKPVAVAELVEAPFDGENHEVDGRRNLRVFHFTAEAGKTYRIDKFFAVTKDGDPLCAPVPEAAIEIAREARALGYDACLALHCAVWKERWARCDVVIEGDPEAQLALRYSILQLLMAAPVKGSANSIPARALSGQVYKGAIFWDTELFMFPFFLHTQPDTALELLRYRVRTLDGARRKARSEGPGYEGAFYAWESQDTGDDACTYFNVGDPITGRELRTHFRDKQVHISADVALAFWDYFTHSGDDSILIEGGAEVILECARFFCSYMYFNTSRGRYEILDVVGPDEYHERVNNNAFTNQMAKETLLVALATVDHLAAKHPQVLRALLDKLEIEAELAVFAEAAELLYVPSPDPETGLIEQFDGYFRLRDETIPDLKARLKHPNEYLGAGQGLAVPTQVIKQADVVMMLTLFKTDYDAAVKQANWAYYEPRTEHGSSLSACAYAMVALEFGKLDFAYNFFLKTAKIDLEANYKLYAGTVFIGGSHPAANGGAWMTAVLGFGGVHADADGLSIRPRLHPKWKTLRFNLSYQHDEFAVEMTHESVRITTPRSNVRSHIVQVCGKGVECRPGESVTAILPAAEPEPAIPQITSRS